MNVRNLESYLKLLRHAKDVVSHKNNEDDVWTKLYQKLIDNVSSANLFSILTHHNCVDIDNGDDIQNLIAFKIGNLDDFILRQRWLKAGAKVEYEDVLYSLEYDAPGDTIHEVTRAEFIKMLNQSIKVAKRELSSVTQAN